MGLSRVGQCHYVSISLRLTSGLTSCLHLHCPHTHSTASGSEQTKPLGPMLHRTKKGGRCKVDLFTFVDPSLVHIQTRERHQSCLLCCIGIVDQSCRAAQVTSTYSGAPALFWNTQPTAALTILPCIHRDHTQGLLGWNNRSYSLSVKKNEKIQLYITQYSHRLYTYNTMHV